MTDLDIKEAKKWWNSLPNGKKRYYKEHCKLTTEIKLTRFYLGSIKKVDHGVH